MNTSDQPKVLRLRADTILLANAPDQPSARTSVPEHRAQPAEFMAGAPALRMRLEGHFPESGKAAADLEMLCDATGVSFNAAIKAFGLKQSTAQCDLQLWRSFQGTYGQLISVFPRVKRSHLRQLLEFEYPADAVDCLKLAVAETIRERRKLTSAWLAVFVARQLSAGKYTRRRKGQRATPTKRTIRKLTEKAYGKATRWNSAHRATRFLENASLALSANETPGASAAEDTALSPESPSRISSENSAQNKK